MHQCLVTRCIHLHIHHTSRTPYLYHSFSELVVYAVTTLIFPKNQRQYASFSINVAILFLSFKWVTTVPNKWIDSQHYKQLRRKTLTTFHLLSHFTLTTTQFNLSFLKILNYSKTFHRLALSFRNPHLFHSNVTKKQATLQSGVHFKPMTNLELSNALTQDSKLVLSFIT